MSYLTGVTQLGKALLGVVPSVLTAKRRVDTSGELLPASFDYFGRQLRISEQLVASTGLLPEGLLAHAAELHTSCRHLLDDFEIELHRSDLRGRAAELTAAVTELPIGLRKLELAKLQLQEQLDLLNSSVQRMLAVAATLAVQQLCAEAPVELKVPAEMVQAELAGLRPIMRFERPQHMTMVAADETLLLEWRSVGVSDESEVTLELFEDGPLASKEPIEVPVVASRAARCSWSAGDRSRGPSNRKPPVEASASPITAGVLHQGGSRPEPRSWASSGRPDSLRGAQAQQLRGHSLARSY